jgi:hypothetical protein
MFLVLAWRFRSTVVSKSSTGGILIAHQFLRAWLDPHGFMLIQGVLVSMCRLLLLIWLLRGWISRVCMLTAEPGGRIDTSIRRQA